MDDVGWSGLLIALLCGGSLFFSLLTVSLRTFSRIRLAEAFKARGKEDRLDSFLANSEKYTQSCALYRLLCNLGLLIVIVNLFAETRPVLATAGGIVLVGVLSIGIPHSWAKYTGELILSRVWPLLRLITWLSSPFVWLMRLHDELVRRLAGVPETTIEERHEEKQEEFLSVVEQGRLEGIVDEEELQMIENVLELNDSTAAEIMTPRTDLVALDVKSDRTQVLETIGKAGHSRIPVFENNIDSIIGMVYAKDLLAEVGKDPSEFRLTEKMRKAYFVPETKPVRDLLHEFQNQKLHIAVVLDEYGGTAGIVTIEDILEELVGEIVDEYEQAQPEPIVEIDANTYEVDARTPIDDVNNECDLDLPEEEDYDTVGGFVFSHLGYIPKAGNTFVYDDLKFQIAAAEARRIRRIRIERLGKTEQGRSQANAK